MDTPAIRIPDDDTVVGHTIVPIQWDHLSVHWDNPLYAWDGTMVIVFPNRRRGFWPQPIGPTHVLVH